MNEEVVFGARLMSSAISTVPQLVCSTAVYVLLLLTRNVGALRSLTSRAAGSSASRQPVPDGSVAVVSAADSPPPPSPPAVLSLSPHAASDRARRLRRSTRRRRIAAAG